MEKTNSVISMPDTEENRTQCIQVAFLLSKLSKDCVPSLRENGDVWISNKRLDYCIIVPKNGEIVEVKYQE